MSILFNSDLQISNIPFLSLIAGLSVCNVLNDFVYNKALIKWPNDIIIENKKICGILLESIIYSKRLSSIILGIGINLNNKDFEKEISHKATSLFLETNKLVEHKIIVYKILEQFSMYYKNFLSFGFDKIIDEYKNLCASLNKNVIIKRDDGDIEAFATDIDNNGNLVVITKDFKKLSINSCEVVIQGIY